LAALGGLTVVFGGPVALVLSLIGLLIDRNKKPAILSLILILLTAAIIFLIR
jgi:hypothetical protein